MLSAGRDSRTAIYFVKAYAYTYSASVIVSFVITRNVFTAALLAVVLNIIPAYLVIFLADKSGGGFANMMYGTGKRKITPHERLEGDMQQATYYKNSKKYEKAKEIVDRILEEEPTHAEALFLKSKIVYEGFGDLAKAKEI